MVTLGEVHPLRLILGMRHHQKTDGALPDLGQVLRLFWLCLPVEAVAQHPLSAASGGRVVEDLGLIAPSLFPT